MSIFHPFVYPAYRAPDGERDESPSIGQRIKEYIDYGLNKVVCGKNEEDMIKNRKSVSFDATVQEAEALRQKEEDKRFKEERNMLERKQKLMDEMRVSHKVM
jgi:archaeosine-15-forming tRNA-guanine transglycosylase